MSQKQLKPTLSGTRNKTRKRDEKERYEPQVFRDAIITGLEDIGNNHDLILKYLCDTATGKLDVKRYGETLLDVLFVGGIISAGGSLEGNVRTEICLIRQEKDQVKSFTNIFIQFIRRYKWLQNSLGEEIRKIIKVMRVCCNENERGLLGSATALLLMEGIIPPNLLSGLTQDHLLKDDVSISFATSLFRTWLQERDMQSLTSTLKKATIDPSLQDIFPPPKRNLDTIQNYFAEQGLNEMVQHVKSQKAHNNRKMFVSRLKLFVNDDEYKTTELANYIKEAIEEQKVTPTYTLQILFSVIATCGDWVVSDHIADDFYQEIKQYLPVFKEITKSEKQQIEFMNKIQEFCYDNLEFMKCFQKIIYIMYQGNVIEEDAIIQWHKSHHSSKGHTEFRAQMTKMVEWLENAEEEDTEEDE